ncbi:hypothetical protein PpSQ1_27105, partial [Pseudomonas putida]
HVGIIFGQERQRKILKFLQSFSICISVLLFRLLDQSLNLTVTLNWPVLIIFFPRQQFLVMLKRGKFPVCSKV